MIELYTWKSPNGRRPIVMLEECGLEYKMITVDPYGDFSNSPEYRKISPGGKVPVIVDPDGPGGQPLALMESSAILLYLAEKTGKFLGRNERERWDVLRWVFFNATNLAVTLSCFKDAPNLEPQVRSVLDSINTHLGNNEYYAGDYSIADMVAILRFTNFSYEGLELADYPNIVRWRDQLMQRPAVRHGHEVVIS